MRAMKWIIFILAMVIAPVAVGEGADKKLIHFGWDMMSPIDLAENVDELQGLPFDGLTVRAKNYCYTFYNRDLDQAAIEADVDAMSRIKWGKFTDNFMYMVAGAQGLWFDDEVWSENGHIIRNVRAIARMGNAGGCTGILFDPEFIYWGQGAGPWNYEMQALRDQKSVDEYRAMVRQRGRQFMDAIESEMSNPVFLTLYWGHYGVEKLAYDTDPKLINEIIGGEEYGLLHDFMVGLLEGADEGTKIVDGNEPSYYANAADDFQDANHFTHETMLGTIPEELRDKYREQVFIGHAVFADHHSNTRGRHNLSTYMTPEERAMCMERIVHLALQHTDEFVWFYSQTPRYLDNVRVAPEMIPAIDRARRNIATGDATQFDFEAVERRAAKGYRQAQSGDFEPLAVTISRAAASPVLDGELNDETWQAATRLGPFRNFLTATSPLDTETSAYMAYDDTNLYVAIRSDDPAMVKLDAGDIDREEEQRGGGDMVEIGIAADEEISEYFHIRLTFANRRWDSLTPASVWPNEISGKNSSWGGEYFSATHVADDLAYWSAEIVIPWAALNRQAPDPGERIAGNLVLRTDRRPSHGQPELASWSPMRMNRLIEARTLGTWEFE